MNTNIHVKLINVDGKIHFCTVVPIQPAHEGLGWGQKVRGEKAPRYALYKGLDDLAEYADTKADQHS